MSVKKDKGKQFTTYGLGQSVLAGNMYVEKNLLKKPPYLFQVAGNHDQQIIYRSDIPYIKKKLITWNIRCKNNLDKYLLACDELTGFIVACSKVRPDGITSLKSKSVLKNLRKKSFAASVDRDEIYLGHNLIGIELSDHVDFIIEILKENQESFREEIEKNKEVYEKIIDDAAHKIETFIQKANSDNQIQ